MSKENKAILETYFQKEINARFDALEKKLNYLLDTQRQILIQLENIEHQQSMLDYEVTQKK